jgi:hypothetical protein
VASVLWARIQCVRNALRGTDGAPENMLIQTTAQSRSTFEFKSTAHVLLLSMGQMMSPVMGFLLQWDSYMAAGSPCDSQKSHAVIILCDDIGLTPFLS